MSQNYYQYEKVTEAYRRDMLREAEQERLVAELPRQRRNPGKKMVYGLGVFLVKLGMWLKQGDQLREPAREQA